MKTKIQKKKSKATRWRRITLADGIWLTLGVYELATDVAMQQATTRWLFAAGAGANGRGAGAADKWPRKKTRRPCSPVSWPERLKPVIATVEIDAYLTDKVPEKLRIRQFKLRSPGEALVRGAQMYRRVYEANEKLGGEPALNPDVKKRIAKRRRSKVQLLVNRGCEPYIWGHDISDLVFETMSIKWLKTGYCRITFGVGS